LAKTHGHRPYGHCGNGTWNVADTMIRFPVNRHSVVMIVAVLPKSLCLTNAMVEMVHFLGNGFKVNWSISLVAAYTKAPL